MRNTTIVGGASTIARGSVLAITVIVALAARRSLANGTSGGAEWRKDVLVATNGLESVTMVLVVGRNTYDQDKEGINDMKWAVSVVKIHS